MLNLNLNLIVYILSPRLSPAQYSLNSAESWPKTPIIHSFMYCVHPSHSAGKICSTSINFSFSVVVRVFGILAVIAPWSWCLQCPSSTYAVTPYLYYPTPQDCTVLTANYAASQCNYHCRRACANALGLSTVPDISVVSKNKFLYLHNLSDMQEKCDFKYPLSTPPN